MRTKHGFCFVGLAFIPLLFLWVLLLNLDQPIIIVAMLANVSDGLVNELRHVLAQLLFDHVLVMGSRQRTLQMDDAENRTVSIAANACCKCNCHQMCRSHFFACASSSIFQC